MHFTHKGIDSTIKLLKLEVFYFSKLIYKKLADIILKLKSLSTPTACTNIAESLTNDMSSFFHIAINLVKKKSVQELVH